jgi:hypothetical protein
VLGDTDPFWMRWCFVADKKGWLPWFMWMLSLNRADLM